MTTISHEVTTKNPRKGPRLRLPGGWQLRVPEIEPRKDDPLFRQFVEYEARETRFRAEAETKASETLREKWRSDWIQDVKAAMRHYMKKYARRYPQLVTDEGHLRGFDAEEVALWYYPDDNHGRRGKRFIRREFQKMAEEAQDEGA